MPVASPDIVEPRPPTAPAPSAEPPVFAASTPRRRRVLRASALGAAGLAGAWLIALVLGVFGFDPLPGLTLPGEHQAGQVAGQSASSGADDSARGRRSVRITGTAAGALPSARTGAERNLNSRSRPPHARRPGHPYQPGGAPSAGASPSSGSASPVQTAAPRAATGGQGASSTAPGQTGTPAGNGAGRSDTPGGRRSPTATPGGRSDTVAAPAPTTTPTGSPGRSGDAPGQNR